ncbi:hypothetical protein IAI10_10765 [Clostridium sp. 19966]|uniref:hypothetical protein n=1 Tax=Clostridium sp. 19966 TaxID=2768166 RepID=UPI0028DEAD4E|nr:hypothetical protein [Clostridium sp. 19966]MDT8717137.1 hypothetical protein [Clostridium sp. 19966]
MRKRPIPYLIVILGVIAALIFIKIYKDNYMNVESTDLSMENVNGISLMEKYSNGKLSSIGHC